MTAILHRERRRTLLPRILSAALLLASAGIGAVAALEWQIETVDASGAYSGEYSSLAIDDAGNPRISYASSGGLRYAAWNGSGWEIGTVDPVWPSGTSLALDAAGAPRIAYYDSAEYDLKYAAPEASGWRVETVDSAGSVGCFPSLALDGAGRPHVGYMDATNRTVRYAAFDGTAWRLETVDRLGTYGLGELSLRLDGSGNPRIAYHTGSGLKYAARDRDAWQIETVGPGRHPSLALDGAGNPRIAAGSSNLVYWVRDGPAWRMEWVDWTEGAGWDPSLALDPAGTPVISYGHGSTADGYPPADAGLKLAVYNASSWTWETGTVDPAWHPGLSSSLALDAAGNPRISYPGTFLKFARTDIPRPGIVVVPGGDGPPTATDAPGPCDDVNGNGRQDFADLVLYFNQLSWIAANEPLAAFDYTANGRIDFADVIRLFDLLGAPARGTFTVRAAAIGPGTIQPSGNLTVREGENVTFTLRVGPGVVTPSGTGSGWIIGNEVRVDPVVAPTPYPEPTKTYGPYPTSYSYTPSYTLRDVRANHTVYGVFYRAGWMTC